MHNAITVHVPQINVNDDRVRIVAWLVVCGDKVEKGQPLVEIETGKSTIDLEATESGYVQFTHQPDDEVAIGDVLCLISPQAPAAHLFPSTVSPAANGAKLVPTDAPVPASNRDSELPPAPRLSSRARACLEANGVDPAVFEGKGLVRESDVLRHLDGKHAARSAPTERSTPDSVPIVTVANGVSVRREPLSRQKLLEGKLLAANYFSALTSSVTVTCSTRGLRSMAARDSGLRGNATALILFEVARLLKQYPVFNAYLHEQHMCCYEKVNIGFAVDAGRGLKVPIIHDADSKGLPAIAAEMHELVAQYLDDRLPAASLSGGTFTITDLSGEGVTTFQPLINQGQAAILGIGAERGLSSKEEGEYHLTLAFDHRLAEGRSAARFLGALRERLRGHEAALTPQSRTPAEKVADASCCRCLRTVVQMKELNGYLVRSAFPDGYLCSFCLGGY